MPYRPEKIVSGGQTGVDRAALDHAIDAGIEHGGWCPAGRMAEDGPIDPRYALTQTRVRSYPARTKMNVRDSDATLILYRDPMGAGTALTMRVAQQTGKPVMVAKLESPSGDRGGDGEPQDSQKIRDWLDQHRPAVLNIAGPRESGSPGVYDATRQLLTILISDPLPTKRQT